MMFKLDTFEGMRDAYQFLRSTRDLMERSPVVAEYPSDWRSIAEQLDFVFSADGFCKTLDIIKIIHSLTERGLGPEESYASRRLHFGLKKRRVPDDGVLARAQEYLAAGSRSQRAAHWQWRLCDAIEECVGDGWFPLFGTYTVDPKRLPSGCLTRDDLWKNTPAWDRFVKRFKTEVADACGYGRKPSKWPNAYSFFRYFGVIEHGASGEHPHIHVVFLCRDIPESWKRDPNANCSTNFETDIRGASALWSHGVQRCTMGLFIGGSWFARNWKIPISKSTLRPVEVGSAAAVACYVGKYLSKGETKKWKHRVKATKNLGMYRLLEKIRSEKRLSVLMSVGCRPKEYLSAFRMELSSGCPLSLLREKSKQELTLRLSTSKSALGCLFLRNLWTKKPSGFYTNYMNSVKDGLEPWKLTREQRYKLHSLMLAVPEFTGHCKKKLLDIEDWLCANVGEVVASRKFTLLKGA